jgi:dolichyl-phosphate beta-glucosyltransferase
MGTIVDLTLVVPAFNEAHRIEPVLAQVHDYQRCSPRRIEVIVVDDGSTDDTVAVVEGFRDRIDNLTVLRLGENQGKGAAVSAGMLAGCGAYRAFLDADGATPVAEVDLLWQAARARPRTVAIGSVACAGARVSRPQPLVRRVAGRLANRVVRLLVLPGIRDSQRGAKLFPAEIADAVFAALGTTGWAFDIEVLARCRAGGYRVVEVPVAWHHVAGGRVDATAYWRTFRELLAIRRRLRHVRRSSAASVAAIPRHATGLAP